jgi:hypothetical protein
MSTEPASTESSAPPAGERVHMPESSILPLINASGLAIAIVSLTLSWWLVAFGGAVFLLSTIRWILDTRRDISNLPLDHQSH